METSAFDTQLVKKSLVVEMSASTDLLHQVAADAKMKIQSSYEQAPRFPTHIEQRGKSSDFSIFTLFYTSTNFVGCIIWNF
jgi:hypothetical protein